MMEGINLYSIDYYKKTVFKGSYRGLCFRIGKIEVPAEGSASADAADGGAVDGGSDAVDGAVDGGSEEMVPVLQVQAWKGPYVLEKTEEEIITECFDYSDDGLREVNEWLESKQKEVVG
ncbi:MAG: hypothetical protein VZQ83_06755 [Eubacterium sp.]|nr:hypothetical protein [Eubacterium sp.]